MADPASSEKGVVTGSIPGGGSSRLPTFVYANLILVSLCAWSVMAYESIRTRLRSTEGPPVFVYDETKSFGTAIPGEYRIVSYTIENRSDRSVRILGCGSTCAVHPADADLPFVLPARSRHDLRLLIRASQPGDYKFPIHVYTSDPDQGVLNLTLEGTIRMPEKDASVRSSSVQFAPDPIARDVPVGHFQRRTDR